MTIETLHSAMDILNAEQDAQSPERAFRPIDTTVVPPEHIGCPTLPSLELRRVSIKRNDSNTV